MKHLILILSVLLVCTHAHELQVQGHTIWFSWFSDQFMMLMWVIPNIFTLLIGFLACFLANKPEVYANMYDAVITGILRLSYMR